MIVAYASIKVKETNARRDGRIYELGRELQVPLNGFRIILINFHKSQLIEMLWDRTHKDKSAFLIHIVYLNSS